MERLKNVRRTLMLSFLRNTDKPGQSTSAIPFEHPQSFEDLAGYLHHTGPVLIYKHSTRCSVSLFAMKRLLLLDTTQNETWVYIDVVAQRPLSLALAEELNILHESPQLILLSEGNVLAHGSHHQVTETTVENWRKEFGFTQNKTDV
ncbi:bacillithiol system redox-active protein YtxJ [Schleiferiaceae bacterium]|nr:bacillithiol system redox-active protein YtxJ [Schleiferiaceae bacterium]MDB2597425.1 bacillithiol system redox-active protein YtxJ [Schleiferiaceae bacterium]